MFEEKGKIERVNLLPTSFAIMRAYLMMGPCNSFLRRNVRRRTSVLHQTVSFGMVAAKLNRQKAFVLRRALWFLITRCCCNSSLKTSSQYFNDCCLNKGKKSVIIWINFRK